MTIDEDRTQNEAAIRARIDALVSAIRAKDVNGAMSVFAPAVVSFDLGPPLRHGGGETFMRRWQDLFESYQSSIDYEIRELSITVGDGVAFSRSLNRIRGTSKNGQEIDRWVRWTACYRKINESWLIVHEHVSVPVDLHGKLAILDLQP